MNITNKQKFTCDCCGYKTLDSKHQYDICPVCFWEDEYYIKNEDINTGGPNTTSLAVAKVNFQQFGACDKESVKFVRLPKNSEK